MTLPFDPRSGLIIIPTRVSGPTRDTIVRLALDTGATGTAVSLDIMVLLGYDPAAAPDRRQVTTGSGIMFVPRLIVDKIAALGQERHQFPILCHTLPPTATVDGVLGLDFFRTRKLLIDFQLGVVTLE